MSDPYFANRKSSKSKPELSPMVRNGLIIALAIAVIIMGIVYSTRVIQSTLVVKATSIYADAFDTPMSSIENLTGDGKNEGFFDVWIRFKCAGGAVLKEQSKFIEKRPSQALNWFQNKFPEDKELKDAKHLSLLWRETSEVTHVTNQWLLYNPASAKYYYRAWGYK
jgi:hypothetical protein